MRRLCRSNAPGRLRRCLGAPLLLGLSAPELQALLCPELGRTASSPATSPALVRRGHAAADETAARITGTRTVISALATAEIARLGWQDFMAQPCGPPAPRARCRTTRSGPTRRSSPRRATGAV